MSGNLMLSGFLIAAVLFILAFLRVIIVKRIDYVGIFLGSLGVFHGILLSYAYLYDPYLFFLIIPEELKYYNSYAWFYCIMIILFGLGTFIGGTISYKNKVFLNAAWHKKVYPKKLGRLVFIGYFLLLTSFVLYWLYAIPYGGFVSLFKSALLIRAGLFEISPQENPFSLFGKLSGISIIASLLFWGLLLGTEKREFNFSRIVIVFGWLCSFVLSIFIFYTWFSRSHIIAYFFAYFLSLVARKYKMKVSSKVVKNITVVIFIVIILFFGTSYIMKGAREFNILFQRIAFAAKVRLLPTFVLLEDPEYRWFKDIVYTPLYLLPQRFWREIVDYTASDIITIKMMGGRKGDPGVSGAMVIGIVPLGFLQAGVLGLAVVSLLWGVILVSLERYLLVSLPPGLSETVYSYFAFRLIISSVWGADPQVVIYNHIDLIVGLIIVLVLSRIQLIPRRKNTTMLHMKTKEVVSGPIQINSKKIL